MTTKVVGIGGGKKETPPLCPYCQKAPASQHPVFTCPRIESVAFDEDVPGWFEVTFRLEINPPPDGDEAA